MNELSVYKLTGSFLLFPTFHNY